MSSTSPSPAPGQPEVVLGAPPEREPSYGVRLGSVAGVPVYLATSWFLIAGLIVVVFGPDIAARIPGLGAASYLVALAYALLLAVSVVAHEVAHAVVARWCGYGVRRIVVNLWGGHTAYDATGETPGHSALVAVSGPAVNALLAGIGYAMLPAVGPGVGRLLLFGWTFSNFFVAAFNLLPGLPLDGGGILDALVWKLSGRQSAGRLAGGWGGRIVAAGLVVFFIVLPLVRRESVNLWTVASVAMVGAFLWAGASAALERGRMMRVLEGITVAQVLVPCAPVPVGTAVGQVPDTVRAVLGRPGVPVVVDRSGAPIGLVDLEAMQRLPETAAALPVESVLVVQPSGWVHPAPRRTDASVAPFVDPLVEDSRGVIVLRADDGHLVGVITVKTLEDAWSAATGDRGDAHRGSRVPPLPHP